MFLLGLLGVIQVVALPGLLIQHYLQIQGGLVRKAVIVFGLSLLFNYGLVFLLTLLGLYLRPVLLGIFVLEIVLGIILSLRIPEFFFFLPIGQFFRKVAAQISFRPDNVGADLQQEDELPAGAREINALAFCILGFCAILSILDITVLAYHYLGTVFTTWDAVVSWNRWATDWFHNHLPVHTWHYPQLIPANWSIAYLFINSPIQFFSKGLMPLFLLGILALMADLAITKRSSAYWIGIVLTTLFLKNALGGEFLADGYVDIPVAFWGVLAISCLLWCDLQLDEKILRKYIYMGGLFAAGAANTKQAGLVLAFLYPVLAYLWVIRKMPSLNRQARFLFETRLFLFVLVLAAPYYLYKEIDIRIGNDTSEIATCTGTVHGNRSLIERFTLSMTTIKDSLTKDCNPYLIYIAGGFLGLSAMHGMFRWVWLLLIIPYTLIWGLAFSYDIRNYVWVIPWLAIGIGLGCEVLFSCRGFLSRCLLGKIQTWVFLFILVGSLFFLVHSTLKNQDLVLRHTELRREIFIPRVNHALYSYMQQTPLKGKILSNYPLTYLPELESYHIFTHTDEYDIFKKIWSEHPNIRYFLISRQWALHPKIWDEVEHNLACGTMKVLFDLEYTFIEILPKP